MTIKRNFKGIWIPKEIWLNKDLNVMEKLFLVEIDSLDCPRKGCYASNKYFAEFFGISNGRCSQIIKGLEAKKILTVELIMKGKIIEKRVIRIVNKLNRGIKNIKGGYLENAQENNTVINNTNIKDIFTFWQNCLNHKKAKLDTKRKEWIKKGLSLYTPDELKAAIIGCSYSAFHMGDNDRNEVYDDLHVIFKSASNIEKFMRIKEPQAKQPTDNKAAIKAEINIRLSKSPHDQYQWQLPEAEQAYKRIMKSCNLWQANDYQINQALSEVL